MFNRSKLQKKEGVQPTDLEEEAAKILSAFETSADGELRAALKFVFINSVEMVEYQQADRSAAKYVLIKIPYRSLAFYKKVAAKVIDHMEGQFKWPVFVVANRTIQSKRAKTHASQKRPRSRTLKAVHNATLHDICVPSSIVGRRSRVSLQDGTTEKVYLDPLDKVLVEEKIDAMAHAYQRLTTHTIALEFAKPTSFQKKKLEQLKQKDQ